MILKLLLDEQAYAYLPDHMEHWTSSIGIICSRYLFYFVCAFLFFLLLSAPPRLHYTEYLVGLIARHKVDPISIFDLTDIQQELRRRGMALPAKGANTTDDEYRILCAKVCQFYILWTSQQTSVQYKCAILTHASGMGSNIKTNQVGITAHDMKLNSLNLNLELKIWHIPPDRFHQ